MLEREGVRLANMLLCEGHAMRPFDILSGRGFREVSEALIWIGVRYSKVNTEDIFRIPRLCRRKF